MSTLRLRKDARGPGRTGPVTPPPMNVERRRPELRAYQPVESERRHGRGAASNPDGRYEPIQRGDRPPRLRR